MKHKKIYLVLRLAVYVLITAAVCYLLYSSPHNPHPTSAEDIRFWVSGFGTWAPVIYVLLYTVRPFLFFPTLLMNLSAGVLFGPWWGMLFLVLGGLGCATTCYLWGRFGGGQWLLENFGGRAGQKLAAYFTGEGVFVKLLWLRTVPIFPYDPISIVAGSVRLPLKIYWVATFLGMLPGAVAYNFLADSFGSPRFYLAILVTVLAFGIPFWLWRRRHAGEGIWRTFWKGSDEDGQ